METHIYYRRCSFGIWVTASSSLRRSRDHPRRDLSSVSLLSLQAPLRHWPFCEGYSTNIQCDQYVWLRAKRQSISFFHSSIRLFPTPWLRRRGVCARWVHEVIISGSVDIIWDRLLLLVRLAAKHVPGSGPHKRLNWPTLNHFAVQIIKRRAR